MGFFFLWASVFCYANFSDYSRFGSNVFDFFSALDFNSERNFGYSDNSNGCLNYFMSFVIQDFLWQCSLSVIILSGVARVELLRYSVLSIIVGFFIEIVHSGYYGGIFDFFDVIAIAIATILIARMMIYFDLLECK